MAVAHRASASPAGDTTTSAAVTIPASVATDDALFALTVNRGAAADGTLTDDDTGGNTWTKIAHVAVFDTATCRIAAWWKRATSGTASKTLTYSGATNSCSLLVSAFSGAETSGNPYANFQSATVDDLVNSVAGFTPSVADTFVCLAVAQIDNTSLATPDATDPDVLSILAQHINGGGLDTNAFIAGATKANTNATGNFTYAAAEDVGTHVWVVIPPAAAGGQPVVKRMGGVPFAHSLGRGVW